VPPCLPFPAKACLAGVGQLCGRLLIAAFKPVDFRLLCLRTCPCGLSPAWTRFRNPQVALRFTCTDFHVVKERYCGLSQQSYKVSIMRFKAGNQRRKPAFLLSSKITAGATCAWFACFNAPRRYRIGGGAKEDRTPDLLRARQALSQLSYGPSVTKNTGQRGGHDDAAWWAWEDLNLRPHPYQGCALTN
jgi:hypothetical protein